MTNKVLFVQGGGTEVHDRWDNKLVASLERELGEDYAVHYPRMPNEADPRYSAWRAALLSEFDTLEDGAIVVGHSVGATILIHVLAEQPPKPRQPRADFSARIPVDVPVFLYHGAEDEVVPFAHVHLYAKAIPQAVVRALSRSNHQLNDDMTDVARDIRAISRSRTSISGQPQ